MPGKGAEISEKSMTGALSANEFQLPEGIILRDENISLFSDFTPEELYTAAEMILALIRETMPEKLDAYTVEFYGSDRHMEHPVAGFSTLVNICFRDNGTKNLPVLEQFFLKGLVMNLETKQARWF